MAKQDLNSEIDELRTQLEEMKKEREAAAAADEQEDESALPDAGSADEAATEDSAEPDALTEKDMVGQISELLEMIDKDIKDAKPTTLLVVFALGVLVGRL
jgi:hypothetical protein